MKKIWKIVIIVAVALGVMAVTCPGRQRHVDAGVKYMSKAKYVLFSVGQMKNEIDGVTTMSVGFLGMVFPNKEALKTDLNLNGF